MVVKYFSLNLSIVLKSNKILDYNYLSSDYDRIITELYDICFKSHIDSFMCDSDFDYMEKKIN